MERLPIHVSAHEEKMMRIELRSACVTVACFLIFSGGMLMNTHASAEDFYQIEVEDGVSRLVFDSAYATGLFNAFKEFDTTMFTRSSLLYKDFKQYDEIELDVATKQDLKNFQVRISQGEGEFQGLIKVYFYPKDGPIEREIQEKWRASGRRGGGGSGRRGGGSSLGRSLTVYFSPDNGEIVKAHYSR